MLISLNLYIQAVSIYVHTCVFSPSSGGEALKTNMRFSFTRPLTQIALLAPAHPTSPMKVDVPLGGRGWRRAG